MFRNSKRAALLAGLVLALATSGFSRTNGGEFFQPAGSGKVDLVYFGFIKDTNGKMVTESAILRVFADELEMHFPFMPDKPGHYRSPDIGAYHKEMGVAVNPAAIRMDIVLPGYRQIRPISGKVPNKTKGVINVDFVVEKI